MSHNDDDIQLAYDYVQAAFALLGRDIPINGTKIDMKKALHMCAHWSAIGEIANLRAWNQELNPPKPYPWPANMPWPPESVID